MMFSELIEVGLAVGKAIVEDKLTGSGRNTLEDCLDLLDDLLDD